MTITEQDITKQALRTAVAQVCLTIGWNSIHQTPLNILVDVLHKYIQTIGRISQNRAELYGRNDSNILDLALTFDDMGVNIPDLEEFIQHIEVAPAKDVPAYPVPAQDNLNHLRPGSKEVLHRPIHVYDYLPAMYPEMEEETEEPENESKVSEDADGSTGGNSSQVTTPTSKRLSGRIDVGQTPKQSDDGCPLREISSVMMTAGGILSPCRVGKLPERGKVPERDPEERQRGPRRHLEETERNSGDFSVNIKQEPGTEIIPPINIKQEAPDVDDMQDYDKMITPQEIHGRGSRKDIDVKPKYTTSENIDKIMDAVIERGIRETGRHGGNAHDYYDGDADVEMAETPKPVVVKKEERRGRPKKNKDAPPAAAAAAKKTSDASDLFSAPQHFTANQKTPPKKTPRIPKITEKVTLPSPSSLMSGIQNAAMGAGMNPLHNPLIPNFGMGTLYGFGNIPTNLIPGFNPGLLNTVAMMQQAAANQAANTSKDSDSAVTIDSELEEGEISPPDTPTVPVKVKNEIKEEVVIKQEKEDESKLEEERLRREEKEREAEAARKKEQERLEKEREKKREEERQKLLLLSQERDRLKKIEEEKDKDRDKSKKEKKKEKKEKKKMKDKEKEKDRKPDEPQLFAPVLKIKPMEAPPPEPTTPKLVIKNIPKNPPPEQDSVPLLGFQPLRQGPARTPKVTPGKVDKRSKRPSNESQTPTPGPGPGPSNPKKPRDMIKKLKTKEKEKVDSDDNTPGITTETVGSYLDESGNKVWICPACGKQDDGSPMIGCDQCDDWYHWLCVGITSEPLENQDWFCTRCVAKKQGLYLDSGPSTKKKK